MTISPRHIRPLEWVLSGVLAVFLFAAHPAEAPAITQMLNVAGDFDGDGYDDVARCVDAGNATFNFWFFMSDGTQFNVRKSSLVSGWGYTLAHWLAADVDGDGRDELAAFYNYGGTSVGVWVFDVTGTTLSGSRPWFTASGWEWARLKPFAGDFDGDGRDELAAAYDYSGGTTGIWTWDLDSAGVTARRAWMSGSGQWYWSDSSFMSGDLDGNGTDEILAYYNYFSGSLGIWTFGRQADGSVVTLGRPWFVSSGWDFNAVKPVMGDVDGDARDEVALLYNYNGWNGWAIGLWTKDLTASASSINQRPWAPPTGSWHWGSVDPVIGDMDRDGKDELVGFYNYGNEEWGLFCWRPDRDNWWAFKFWSKPAGAWTEAGVPAKTGTFAIIDTAAPTTTISGVGSTWSSSPVTFALTATDGAGGRGVAGVFYSIDGAPTVRYTTPVTISTEGESTLRFWSQDVVTPPNTESAKQVTVRIDKTAPVTASDAVPVFQRSATIKLTAADALSGVASTEYRLDGGGWTPGTIVTTAVGGDHVLGFRSTDAAGNIEAERTVSFSVELLAVSLSYSLSSTTPEAGDAVIVSGRLTSSASPLAGVTVKVQSSPDGSAWTEIGSTVTNASGDYTVSATPLRWSYLRVVISTTVTHASATSVSILVSPRFRPASITLGSSAAAPGQGTSFTLSGRLADAGAAPIALASVKLQRSTDGVNWVDAASLVTDASGDYSSSVTVSSPVHYRALFGGNARFAGATSAEIVVAPAEADDEITGSTAPRSWPQPGVIRDAYDLRDVYRVTVDGSGNPIDFVLNGPSGSSFDLAVFGGDVMSLDAESPVAKTSGTSWPKGLRFSNTSAGTTYLVVQRRSGSGSYTITRTTHDRPEARFTTASPRRVRYGSAVSVRASVLERTWVQKTNPVQLKIVSGGKTRYVATTSSDGVVAYALKPTARTVVSVRNAAVGTNPAGSWSAPLEVRVTHALAAPVPSKTAVKRGERISLRGVITPSHPVGTKVILEAVHSSGRVIPSTVRVKSRTATSCTWVATGTLGLTGTWRFRARLASDSQHDLGVSGVSRGVAVR